MDSCGVVVITLVFDTRDRGSIPRRRFYFCYICPKRCHTISLCAPKVIKLVEYERRAIIITRKIYRQQVDFLYVVLRIHLARVAAKRRESM